MILLTFAGTRQSDREAKNAIVSGSLPYYGLDDDESLVCTENLIRVADVMDSPKLAE
jgi:hypothetical protein